MLQTDHWNKNTVEMLMPYVKASKKVIRIATGYFTVQGFDLLRDGLVGKRVLILVGYDETSKERLREAVIENILAHLRHWDAPNRREAVQALVDKLQNKEFEIVEQRDESLDYIDSRIHSGDHTKVYIFDDKWVLNGSANLSYSGLRKNREGIVQVNKPERVLTWLNWFNGFWNHPKTISLTEELLRVLLAWLALNPPFDIYLKTIHALVAEEDITPPRSSYKMPIKYQWIVINRTLRQLETYRGSMLVASTGLGKTIMATHTALLLRDKKNLIRNVIVFAPKAVRKNWRDALDSAGINNRVFVREVLDNPLRTCLKSHKAPERVGFRAKRRSMIWVIAT